MQILDNNSPNCHRKVKQICRGYKKLVKQTDSSECLENINYFGKRCRIF